MITELKKQTTIIQQSVCCEGLKGRRWRQGSVWLRCLGAAQETIKKTSQSEKFACYNSSDNVWTLKLLLAFIDAVPLKYPLHSPHNLAFRSTLALPSKHFDIWWADVSLSLHLCMYFLSCSLIVNCYFCNLIARGGLATLAWYLSPRRRYFDIIQSPTAAEVTLGCGKNMWLALLKEVLSK